MRNAKYSGITFSCVEQILDRPGNRIPNFPTMFVQRDPWMGDTRRFYDRQSGLIDLPLFDHSYLRAVTKTCRRFAWKLKSVV